MRYIKKVIWLLSCLVITLCYSCQKEGNNPIHVKLIADKPVNSGTNSWTISGRVISSGKIDFVKHGFHVTIGTNASSVEFNELKKGGKVETIIEVTDGEAVSNVIFYAIDDKGRTYMSDPVGDPVTITAPIHYYDGVGERFDANALISDVSKYAITAYGIEYRLAGSSDPWLDSPAMVSYFNTPTVPITIQIPSNIGVFVPPNEYEYRIYIKYYDLVNGTSENRIYSVSDTFIASMPS